MFPDARFSAVAPPATLAREREPCETLASRKQGAYLADIETVAHRNLALVVPQNKQVVKLRPPGRPRSERADRAILRATLELLAQRGYEGLTMEAIAECAGVGKATVYRRWSSKAQVLTAAVAGFVTGNPLPDTGQVEADLLQLIRGAVRNYQGLPGRIMPGLVAAMAQDAVLAHTFRAGFLADRHKALQAVLERGIQRGELRDDINVPLAVDFLGGALFFRLLISGGPLDDALADGTVEIMLRGLRPAS